MVRYVPPREYRKHVDVSHCQLRYWANQGKIDYIRSPGGNRLYRLDLNSKAGQHPGPSKIAYVRVSSSKQREDLERQSNFMAERFPDFTIVSDVGSGINWSRPGLLAILDSCIDGHLKELAIASRDRLCRFSFELIEYILKKHGVKLTIVESSEKQSDEEDLANDLLSIVQVFCCRRNGKRQYSKLENAKNKNKPNTAPETEASEIQ